MSIQTIISKLCKKNTDLDNTLCCYIFDSPVGKTIAVADDDYLYIVAFEDTKNLGKKLEALATELSCKFVEDKNKILQKFEQELTDYFEGNLKKFTVPVKSIGSEFQKAVWDKLVDLPYGSTQTYADLAKDLGRPASHSRAVGAACGANPLLLVVPCHRLVASGSKGGYNSGKDRKEKLLLHESKFSS